MSFIKVRRAYIAQYWLSQKAASCLTSVTKLSTTQQKLYR